MTLLQALEQSTTQLSHASCPSPRLDSELILAAVLQTERSRLLGMANRPLTDTEAAQWQQLLNRRLAHEPLAYITGQRYFYHHCFSVDQAVLIPRPETELLVEQSLQFLQQRAGVSQALEMGTGSGAIAISLIAAQPQLQMLAVDLSAAALAVAQKNAQRLLNPAQQARLQWRQDDLFSMQLTTPVDLLVSNPPYIPSPVVPTLEAEIINFEPHLALDGGADGLKHLLFLIRQARHWLKADGCLLLECGAGQAALLKAQIETHLTGNVKIIYDLAGIGRCLVAQKEGKHVRKISD